MIDALPAAGPFDLMAGFAQQLRRLLARFPSLELADAQPRWRRLINLRGLEALPLRGMRAQAA